MAFQFDLSLSASEDARLRRRLGSQVESWAGRVHLTKTELLAAVYAHWKLTKGRPIDRHLFRDIVYRLLGVRRDEMVDRIYSALDSGTKNEGLGLAAWLTLLSLATRGHSEEKIAFCFAAYDPLGLGYLTRDSMTKLLRPMVVSKADDSATDLMEILMRRMDTDRDGRVTFSEYRDTVLKCPGLLQCFGFCLPDEDRVAALLAPLSPSLDTSVVRPIEADKILHRFKGRPPLP